MAVRVREIHVKAFKLEWKGQAQHGQAQPTGGSTGRGSAGEAFTGSASDTAVASLPGQSFRVVRVMKW